MRPQRESAVSPRALALTVDQVHEAVPEDGDGRQAPGLRVGVETLDHQHPVVQAEALVGLPAPHVRTVGPDHTCRQSGTDVFVTDLQTHSRQPVSFLISRTFPVCDLCAGRCLPRGCGCRRGG